MSQISPPPPNRRLLQRLQTKQIWRKIKNSEKKLPKRPKKNPIPYIFHKTCFNQTGILGIKAKQDIYKQRNKTYETETKTTNLEKTKIEQKKLNL